MCKRASLPSCQSNERTDSDCDSESPGSGCCLASSQLSNLGQEILSPFEFQCLYLEDGMLDYEINPFPEIPRVISCVNVCYINSVMLPERLVQVCMSLSEQKARQK